MAWLGSVFWWLAVRARWAQYAVQFARLLGARQVITTVSSPAKAELVDIAANASIDMEVIRPDGMWVVYGSGARQFSLAVFPMISRNILVRFFIVYHLSAADRLRTNAVLGDFLHRDQLQHSIAARLPLASIAQAHDLVEAGSVVGNVVVSID